MRKKELKLCDLGSLVRGSDFGKEITEGPVSHLTREKIQAQPVQPVQAIKVLQTLNVASFQLALPVEGLIGDHAVKIREHALDVAKLAIY